MLLIYSSRKLSGRKEFRAEEMKSAALPTSVRVPIPIVEISTRYLSKYEPKYISSTYVMSWELWCHRQYIIRRSPKYVYESKYYMYYIFKYDLLGVEGGFKPDDENRMT